MKYKPSYAKRFKKDWKKCIKRGYDMALIKNIILTLIAGEELPSRYKDHKLIGNYTGRRECHVQNDWLLIYKVENREIIFERTGTHSDLFKN